jgi:hypothetical protein
VGWLGGSSRRWSGGTDWAAAASGARAGAEAAKTVRDEVVDAWGKFRVVIRNDMLVGYVWYICLLIDKYTGTYIHRLTNECTRLCSLRLYSSVSIPRNIV